MVLALGDYMSVQCHACIGGTNLGEDIRKLDYGQHVVSGTPGRVFDMIRRRTLRTRSIKVKLRGLMIISFMHGSKDDKGGYSFVGWKLLIKVVLSMKVA